MNKWYILTIIVVLVSVISFVFMKDVGNPNDVEDVGKNEPIPKVNEKSYMPDFVSVRKYRKSEESVYGDVMSHVQGAQFGDSNGRTTNAHETTHQINSEIRMAAGFRSNGFYVLQGLGVVLQEPNIKMENVIKYVPKNLRSYRWNLYMEKQLKNWNDRPTYIFDEWVSYVNGGSCGVDDVKNGRYNQGWLDAVSGCCDFSIYSIALAMAVKQEDPEYWNKLPQFKNFVIWELKNAKKTFLEGRVMKEFKWETQDQLLLEFLTSSEAEPMRQFCRSNLDGAWLDINPDDIRSIDYEGSPRNSAKVANIEACAFCNKKPH